MGLNSTDDIVQILTEAREVEKFNEGSDQILSLKTLPDILDKYKMYKSYMDRDLESKRAKNKMFEDDKDRIEAAATNFVKELRAGTMLLRLVQEDLGPTLATANSVMATNKTERGGFGETNTRVKKWQLVNNITKQITMYIKSI